MEIHSQSTSCISLCLPVKISIGIITHIQFNSVMQVQHAERKTFQFYDDDRTRKIHLDI